MRLIDADRLKKELREFLVNDNHVNNPSTTCLDVLDVVEEQPTAYDTEGHDKQIIRDFAEWLPQHFDLRFSNDPDMWLAVFFIMHQNKQ